MSFGMLHESEMEEQQSDANIHNSIPNISELRRYLPRIMQQHMHVVTSAATGTRPADEGRECGIRACKASLGQGMGKKQVD